MAKIPVGATIAKAYRFAFGDFLKILGVMWPAMLAMWLPGLLMQPQMMALSAQVAARDYSGMRELWPILLLFYLAALVLIFMQVVGIAQLALGRQRNPGWIYFELGKPLWRLIGSFLLLMVAVIVGWIAVILFDVILGFLLKLLATGSANALVATIVGIITIVILVASWGAFFYSFIRLSFLLVPVVAAEEEGFALGRSWTLGLGNFWRIFVILLATLGPFIVLEFVFLFGFALKGLTFPPAHATAAQMAAYQAAVHERTLGLMNAMYHYWYVTYPITIVAVVILYGLCTGAQCFAYRSLTEGEASAPVAAD